MAAPLSLSLSSSNMQKYSSVLSINSLWVNEEPYSNETILMASICNLINFCNSSLTGVANNLFFFMLFTAFHNDIVAQ